MSDRPADRATSEPRGTASAIALGLALAALGVLVAVQGGVTAIAQTYARVGPEVFPRVVGAGLTLIGMLLALDAWRRRWRVEWMEHAPGDAASGASMLRHLKGVGLMLLGLFLAVVLIGPAGFIAATTALFLCVSVAFGSRNAVRDLAIGLAFTTAVFLIFTKGLGLPLPLGRLWSS